MKEICEVIIDEVVEYGKYSSSETTVGIGRLKPAERQERTSVNELMALVEVSPDAHGSKVTVPRDRCIVVPPAIDRKLAALTPSLVCALWAWDELFLELGDTAVFTGLSPLSGVVGQVALWRGGCPVIGLQKTDNRIPAVEYAETDSRDGEAILKWLGQFLNDAGGFAAIDLDGRPGTVDVLMEALPRWGRLMLAGEAREPITIDYYNNIHRKGALVISTRLEPTMIFHQETRPEVGGHIERAFRILQNRVMVQELLEANRDFQGAAGD
jgi:threonine dehydrogenase-like Zn-dependent dehydrogenase